MAKNDPKTRVIDRGGNAGIPTEVRPDEEPATVVVRPMLVRDEEETSDTAINPEDAAAVRTTTVVNAGDVAT